MPGGERRLRACKRVASQCAIDKLEDVHARSPTAVQSKLCGAQIVCHAAYDAANHRAFAKRTLAILILHAPRRFPIRREV